MNNQESAVIRRVPRTYCGKGCLENLVTECARVRAHSVLFVTEEFFMAHPLVRQLFQKWEESGINVHTFTDVRADPDLELVDILLRSYRDSGIDLVIALGGGSAIDLAKVAALGLSEESKGHGLNCLNPTDASPALPLFTLPTTAGTGSEVTSVAVLTDHQNRVKKGIVSEQIIPQVVFLEPELTRSLPPAQTAFTGLDALTHAVEAFTSTHANAITDVYAREAISLVLAHLRTAFLEPENMEARRCMQLAAYWAGLAFGNAGVTAAHALAYPLGARHHVPHGLAVILLLPAVLRHNSQHLGRTKKWTELESLLSQDNESSGLTADAAVTELCRSVGVVMGLESIGVKRDELREMAESASEIERILKNNPAPLLRNPDAIYAIYLDAFSREGLKKEQEVRHEG